MASLAPDSRDRHPTAYRLIDRTLLAIVALAGIGSSVLLMFLLESPVFAAGFGALFVTALGVALIAARRRPADAAVARGPDRALIRTAIEGGGAPVAVTDRQGLLVVANSLFERDFRGAPTPPALPFGEEGVDRLTNAGRTAWRDGRGTAPALRTPQGIYDAVVERGGEQDDFLIWRFMPAAGTDMVGEARRLLESAAGNALGIAGVMAVLVDSGGRMIAANQVFRKRALGSSQERLRGRDFTDCLETGEDRLLRMAREGEDGPPLRLVQVPIPTASDEADPLLFFLLDEIPGPGRATDSADIHALLGMLPLGLALAERDGRFLYINAAFRRAAGLADDAQPVYPGDLVVDEDKTAVANAVRRFANSASISADIALRLRHQPDETVAMTVAGAPGLGEAAVLLSLKDNSEDEKLKRQVAQATKMQAVGQLAGGVAHDFNNILTAIIGHCDLMLLRHTPGDSDYDDIQQIKSNSNRAAGLTRQLLAFSRQQTLRPQILQLPDVVSEVSNLLKRLLGETVSLDIHHGRNLGPVRADPGQLEQVIVNLAVNARDAIQSREDGDGRGTLTLETFAVSAPEVEAMSHDVMPAADYTAFRLTDTGIGIAPEALGKIFEPFYTTKEVGRGTGLGLSTVYGIVKQSGGYIFADSEVGTGTAFTIYLPAHRGDAAVGAQPSAGAAETPTESPADEPPPPTPAPATEAWGSGTVLVVEDEDMVRAVAERALTRQGYSVVTAEDGEDALRIIAERQDFDLILSDVVMPGMDGPTMATELRETMPDVPILFMSGYAEEQLRKSIDIEQVHFLPKPFSVQQLAEAVRDIMKDIAQ
ncbi:response regulator [Parasphingopyxis algicola]|uniref:response regulator n=1 Tax=Parasphingopyxis algicola TaxID=2026624 RepID=UPI0015A0C7DC|nr:response regulator [Parasphingopyxis algicola]QLC24139.1 response regulator [Parasphingopyxis algicola]